MLNQLADAAAAAAADRVVVAVVTGTECMATADPGCSLEEQRIRHWLDESELHTLELLVEVVAQERS